MTDDVGKVAGDLVRAALGIGSWRSAVAQCARAMAGPTPQKTVFLDRDGTINVNHGYVHRVEDFEFIRGVPEALRELQRAGYRLVVITNQSGIARGMFSAMDVERLHRHMSAQLSMLGVEIAAYYYCPLHPDYGGADLERIRAERKPGLGMFRRACRAFAVDVPRSFMVGDHWSDVAFGQRAGLQSILVGEPGPPPLDMGVDVARTWRAAALWEAVALML